MRHLDLTLRQRTILSLLQYQTEYVTSSSLAARLKLSGRTIRNDIKAINELLAPYHACIESIQSKGFMFRAEDPAKIRDITRIESTLFSRTERIRYLAYMLCQTDTPQNLYDLEEELCISKTALATDIQSLREKYEKGSPNIRIVVRKNTLAFERDEDKIRSVLLNLIHENWDYHAHGNAYYEDHYLNSELIGFLKETTPVVLHEFGFCMDDPTLTALELTIAITHERCTGGYPFPDTSLSDTDENALHAARALMEQVSAFTGYAYPESEIIRIARFVFGGSLPIRDWNASDTPAEIISEPIRGQVIRYLQEIRNVYGINFRNDPEFIRVLSLYFQELMYGSSQFSKHPDVTGIKRSLSAEFELAWLYQTFAQAWIGRYLNENELCSLSLLLSGAIRHYLEIHPEKKLKTVLFSHRNMAFNWSLKRQVLETFRYYVDIQDILPVNMKDVYDFSNTDLILTTVRQKIIDSEKPATVILEETPVTGFDAIAMDIKFLSFKKIWPQPNISMKDLFQAAYHHDQADCKDPDAVIRLMVSDYIRDGIADETHLSDILFREQLTSYAIDQGTVFIFTNLPAARTQLSMLTLRHHIRWNRYPIHRALMAMFEKKDLSLLFHLKITPSQPKAAE